MKKHFYQLAEACSLYADFEIEKIYEFEIKGEDGLYIVVTNDDEKVKDIFYHEHLDTSHSALREGIDFSIRHFYSSKQLTEIYNVIQVRCHLEDSLKNFLQ